MRRVRVFLLPLVCAYLFSVPGAHAQTNSYKQTNLVSDTPGLAPVIDPNPVNPWGIGIIPGGTFWIADNGSPTGVTSLYKGLALVAKGSERFLLATNFRSGQVEICDPTFKLTQVLGAGAFNDSSLPAVPAGSGSPRYAAFGLQLTAMNNTSMVAVTYALQDRPMHHPLKIARTGYVDLFSTDGAMLRRGTADFYSNAPWGVVDSAVTLSCSGQPLGGHF